MVLGLLLLPSVTGGSESASRSGWIRSRYSGVCATTAVVVTAALLLGLAGWPPSARAFEVVGLMLAAIAGPRSIDAAQPRSSQPPRSSWTLPRCYSAAAPWPRSSRPSAWCCAVLDGSARRRVFADVAVVVASIQSAGFVHARLGGTVGHFEWPWQGVPIAAAAVAYCLVQYTLMECVVPFVTRRPVNVSWPRLVVRDFPDFILAAVVSVVVVAAIEHRMWGLLFAAAMPLVFVYRTHFRHLDRLEREQRHHDVIEFLDQGICVLDRNGQITLWNDALQHMVDCSRTRALGRTLAAALPVLAKTEFQRAFDEALSDGRPRMLSRVPLPVSEAIRILQVKILPGRRLRHGPLERRHRSIASGGGAPAKRRALCVDASGRQRRLLGVGDSESRNPFLGAMESARGSAGA